MENDEDLAAVRAVVAGNASAFRSIVERWQGPLFNLAYRFCRDRSQAADMAQDAFLKIFRVLPSFRAESLFSTWMISVATNVFRSHQRRTMPELLALDTVPELPFTRESGPSERTLREETVRRTVQALPAKYREAVVLFYFHEMNVTRAADTLGIPPGTLKARLHRARALLERRLRSRLGPDPLPEEA
jgi:RNA polymerase sigma-70 factor (ECF subfamily)